MASPSQRVLTDCRIFTGDEWLSDHAVVIETGRIAKLVPAGDVPRAATRRSLAGGLLAPGFVDVQVNGGGGVLFNAMPKREGLRALARAHRRFGTTALLPTLVSDVPGTVLSGMAAVRAAMSEGPGDGARVLGIHLEGPFLNPERAGAHARELIRQPSGEDLSLLTSLGCGRTVVTLAPECVPAGTIERLVAAGVRVCAGHSNATYEQVQAALREGLSGFTHLFNAMPPLAGREPGILGAALADRDSYCGIIVDGIHVHPASLQVALAAKTTARMMLVTDAMPPVGCEEHEFELLGQRVTVKEGRCTTPEGRLAGSVLDMASAVRNGIAWLNLSMREALRMASLYPATFLGLERELGRIAPGHRADLVLLDNEMRVRATWVEGSELRVEA